MDIQQGMMSSKALARRMEGALRTVDKVARLGGEEFGVLLPNSSKVGGRMVAERIRAAIEASPIPTVKGPLNAPRVSVAPHWIPIVRHAPVKI